jgi:uncharacterized protein HemX
MIRMRIYLLAALAIAVALLAGRYVWMQHRIARQEAQLQSAAARNRLQAAQSEAEIFSARALAELRTKEEPHEINLSRGVHVLDF